MDKTTRLTQQDLQIYPSQRMTDTDDGGGLMTGKPLTGADNEIFPPVSDVDRTMGSFDARLLYPAVLRNDAEPLYGGHFVISEPPEAQNVSFLAFKAKNYGEERQDIMPRIEAYSVPTIESRMTMMGKHLSGSRMVQAYQRTEAPLPKVGERYCLSRTVKENAVETTTTEYFRIQNLEHEIRTFEIVKANGEVKEIQRRVLKMEITNALVNDFVGVDYPVEGYANPATKILETQVSDSANYYGVKPVQTALKKGDAQLKVSSIYEKLVPTSTIETPYADQYPVPSEMWVAAGLPSVVFNGYVSGGSLTLPCSVIPGSVSFGNYKDNALGQLSDGSRTVSIDYANGVISNLPSGNYAITATAGAKASAARYAFAVEVKETNQGTAWAPLLRPAPALGSLTVSFMTLGVWYTLTDSGDGIVRSEDGTSVGTVSESSGSVILNLPTQPDVGSKIVFQWGGISGFAAFDGGETGKAVQAKASHAVNTYSLGHPIKPGTLVLSWQNNGNKTARDNGERVLSGDASGKVDYINGIIYTDSPIAAGAISYSCDVPDKITHFEQVEEQSGVWVIDLPSAPIAHGFALELIARIDENYTGSLRSQGTLAAAFKLSPAGGRFFSLPDTYRA